MDPSISLYIRSNSLFIIYSQHFYQDPSLYARPIIIQLNNYTQNIIPCLSLSFCSVRFAPQCTAFRLVEKLGNAHGFYIIIIAWLLHAAMLVYMYNYYTQPCVHDVLHTAHTASAKWNFAGAWKSHKRKLIGWCFKVENVCLMFLLSISTLLEKRKAQQPFRIWNINVAIHLPVLHQSPTSRLSKPPTQAFDEATREETCFIYLHKH